MSQESHEELRSFINNTNSIIDSYLQQSRNIITNFENLKNQGTKILARINNSSSKDALHKLIEDFPINELVSKEKSSKTAIKVSLSPNISILSNNSVECKVVIDKLPNNSPHVKSLLNELKKDESDDEDKSIDRICNLEVSFSKSKRSSIRIKKYFC